MDETVANPGPQAPQQNLPVVVQPDPMLEAWGGIFRTVAVSLGACAVVALVLYGMTRPEAPQQQMANAPGQATQTPPAAGGGAQAQKPEPSTTGQGQSGEPAKTDQSKSEKSEGQSPRSDSSSNAGPKNQPQQQAQ